MATAATATSSNFNPDNARFSGEAADWDKRPFVAKASKEALDAILKRFSALSSDKRDLDILEIGCGTGLLSFLIAPYAKTVVAVDAAQGMIDVLTNKTQAPGAAKNIVPVCVMLEDPEDSHLPPADVSKPDGPRMKFDLIISHLALHHIPDLSSLLGMMKGCLKDGGSTALTDFEDFGPEARRFHSKAKLAGVERDGINAEAMAKLMREAGFANVRVERAWSMEKKVEKFEGEFGEKGVPVDGKGETAHFPFVLCIGEKS